jgi:hypothetical protein
MNKKYLYLSFTGDIQSASKFSVTEKLIYTDLLPYINTEVYLLFVSPSRSVDLIPTAVVSDCEKAFSLFDGLCNDKSIVAAELCKATLIGFEKYNALVFNDDLKQIKKHEQELHNSLSGR